MTDDVVAELDRWLAVWASHFGGTQSVDMEVVQRARDEIVALRKLTDGDWVWKQITDTRAEALEEAARVCERGYTTGSTGSTQEHVRNSIEDLGRLIVAKRVGRGVRAAALEVGVSPATLSRVENGHMPDLETFAKICQWLDRDPREFLGMEVRDCASGQPRTGARECAAAIRALKGPAR